MEPLGATSAIISITVLTTKVISLLYDFQEGTRHAHKEIFAIKKELRELRNVLERLEEISTSTDRTRELDQFNCLESPLQSCRSELQQLETTLSSNKGRLGAFGQALTWPFKGKEIKKSLEVLAAQRATLQLALTADNSAVLAAINGGVSRTTRRLSAIDGAFKDSKASDRRKAILSWLNPPDPFTNHNKACHVKQPETGVWLLNSDEYLEWRTRNGSTLWLHGIPGCGKTVLCSSVYEDVAFNCRSRQDCALACFYFDFNDVRKQGMDGLLCSIIVQMLSGDDRYSLSLDALYERCNRGAKQPTKEMLLTTLRGMLQEIHECFIVLDALDECRELEELLLSIQEILSWDIKGLHLICSSRRERQIEETLDVLIRRQVSIMNTLVDADIGLLVHDQLEKDSSLRKWPDTVKNEIQTALTQGSQGMFRWAVCQLDTLRKCYKLSALRAALESLPKTLNETYNRILGAIDADNMPDALQLLQWLTFSRRPLRLRELAEVVAIDIEDIPCFNEEDRLRHPTDLLRICSSLVNLNYEEDDIAGQPDILDCEIRLAHYSVREYLVSKIGEPTFANFAETPAHLSIGKSCVAYLLHLGQIRAVSSNKNRQHHETNLLERYPLSTYAAQYWPEHARYIDNVLQDQIVELLINSSSMNQWIEIFNPDHGDNLPIPARSNVEWPEPASLQRPLYYASLLGLIEIVEILLGKGAKVQGGFGLYGTALGAAATRGHTTILRLLLDSGAKPNAAAGYYRSPLFAAVSQGHAECVRLLIEAGNIMNDVPRFLDTGSVNKGIPLFTDHSSYHQEAPLLIAAEEGHLDVVKVLLDHGASMTVTGYYGNAVQAAMSGGHNEVVEFLLDRGLGFGVPAAATPWTAPFEPASARRNPKRRKESTEPDTEDVVLGNQFPP